MNVTLTSSSFLLNFTLPVLGSSVRVKCLEIFDFSCFPYQKLSYNVAMVKRQDAHSITIVVVV